MSDAETKPMLEMIIERLAELSAKVERRFDALDVRLDRIESDLKKTQCWYN